jgi:hypothetical protein
MSDPAAMTEQEDAAEGSGGEGPPLEKTTWKDVRHEIAQEPGNHGRFALWCGLGVVLLLTLFFVVRVWILR